MGRPAPPQVPRANFSSTLIQRGASQFANTSKGSGVTNEPTVESTKIAGVYGISKKLTRGQALGNTGGAQTTYLDCTINGVFFGKFTNKLDDHFKGNKGISSKSLIEVAVLKTARWTNYPNFATKPDNWNSSDYNEGAPHAEDLLIIALATAYNKNNNFFKIQGNPVFGKNPVLSIRINNSPCERCARNLVRACATYGLSLRIKASFHYEKESADSSGTSILHAAGVPVWQWRSAQITNKTSVASPVKRRGSITEATYFKAARNDTNVQDASWQNDYKRANLNNMATIKSYAEDNLMM